ncbi:MAG: hypothetical protein Q8Q81_16555, partial [Oxalobacteraceae bacterium]|nr:hypothetical protein [Oxalobacteraceae bacterium]
EVVCVGENGVTEADLLVHDETAGSSALAFLLAQLEAPEFPVPLGVFRALEMPTYQQRDAEQAANARQAKGKGSLASLLNSGDTWTID